MADFFHVGDHGVRLEVQFVKGGQAKPIPSATVKILRIRAPGGRLIEQSASYSSDGSDGKIYWTIPKGFLTKSGVWYVQGIVEFPGARYTTEYKAFDVKPLLANTAP